MPEPMSEERLRELEVHSFHRNGFSYHAVAELCVEVRRLTEENQQLTAKLNTPELHDFASGVISEAQHQRHRWGSDHDAGKEPQDWFWLLGYLGGKALSAHSKGDTEKALHHTVSSAAVLANWHAAILGQTNMRPGIDPVEMAEARKDSDRLDLAFQLMLDDELPNACGLSLSSPAEYRCWRLYGFDGDLIAESASPRACLDAVRVIALGSTRQDTAEPANER